MTETIVIYGNPKRVAEEGGYGELVRKMWERGYGAIGRTTKENYCWTVFFIRYVATRTRIEDHWTLGKAPHHYMCTGAIEWKDTGCKEQEWNPGMTGRGFQNRISMWIKIHKGMPDLENREWVLGWSGVASGMAGCGARRFVRVWVMGSILGWGS